MTAILLDDAKIPHRKNEFELFYGFIQENRFNFIEKKTSSLIHPDLNTLRKSSTTKR